jgi:hypothetical protein
MARPLVRSLTAGTKLVQLAIAVQLPPLTRLLGRPTWFLGRGRLQPQRLQLPALALDLKETTGVRLVQVVGYNFGAQPALIAVKTLDRAPTAASKPGGVVTRYQAELGDIKEVSHSLARHRTRQQRRAGELVRSAGKSCRISKSSRGSRE